MTSVTQFAQHLMKLDPNRTVARQCLYNYLRHVLDPIEPMTPTVIHDFYSRVLHFEYWIQNANVLGEAVEKDLQSYLNSQPEVRDLEWGKIRHAHQIQTLLIQKEEDFGAILSKFERARIAPEDQVKFIRMSTHETLSLVLSTVGTLEVRVYPHRARVQGSDLEPLAPTSHLFYNSRVELIPHVKQVVEGSLLTLIAFSVEEDGVHGVVSRGHSFQKFETFMTSSANDHFDLFNQIKKIERHFVDPQSDPYYRELVSQLERMNLSLANPTPLQLQNAEKTLRKGQSALKNAFPGDRLLQLLVTHLDYGISQAKNGKAKHDSSQQIPR